MRKKRVYIIMLHHKYIDMTIKCLKSLFAAEPYPFHVILVNNSLESLSQPLFKNKKIIVSDSGKDLGFAKGVNVGVRIAQKEKADFILLLNNDTTITRPFLQTLITTSLSNHDIGIVAPAIAFMKGKKKIYDIGGKYSKFFGRTTHREIQSCKGIPLVYAEYVSGCCMLIRKDVIKKIGLFDESFFLYYEDIDFCLRAEKAGYKVVVNPSVAIYHALSKTIGKLSEEAVYHQTRSAVIFGKKYFTKWYRKILHTFFLIFQILLFCKYSPEYLIVCIQAVRSVKT